MKAWLKLVKVEQFKKIRCLEKGKIKELKNLP